MKPDDVGFGSVWWVKEELWASLEDYRPGRMPRPWGPGVSIHRKPVMFEYFPALFGTGDADGPVIVRGLCGRDPEKVTSFGQIVAPALISTEDMHQHRARPNWAKPKLDAEETKNLADWCQKRKGLCHE